MSEDSGSCMSSRDVSPAGKLRRRRRRERRLPTFINLGNGTTLTAERKDGGPTNASHSSVTQSVETTHTQPPVTSRSTTTVADTSYGLPAVEALSISPLSSVDTEYFTHGGGAPSSSGNYSPAAPTSMPLFEGSAHQAFHAGRHRRNSSASSAGATPQSPAQWSPMPPQLATVRTNQSERGSFNTVATSPSPIARNVSTPPTGLSHFEAFTPAHDDGGHRRSPSTSSTGVGAWSPAVWSPAPQQRAVSRPQQRESGWTGPGWQESMPTVEFVSRRESFLPYGGIDRSARR